MLRTFASDRKPADTLAGETESVPRTAAAAPVASAWRLETGDDSDAVSEAGDLGGRSDDLDMARSVEVSMGKTERTGKPKATLPIRRTFQPHRPRKANHVPSLSLNLIASSSATAISVNFP